MNTTQHTDPYQLAKDGLCEYSGDIHPLNYGGMWFNPSNWEKHGYASAVEVVCLDDGPDGGKHVVVSKIVINKPKPEDMARALKSCGIEDAEPSVWIQIESCKWYGFHDPDCSDYREPSSVSFIIPDDEEEANDFTDYARIHDATIADDSAVWALLHKWVGRDSCE